jgi:hypothetical protein
MPPSMLRSVKLVPVPELSTGLLVIAGMLGFAGWRRARAWHKAGSSWIPESICAPA